MNIVSKIISTFYVIMASACAHSPKLSDASHAQFYVLRMKPGQDFYNELMHWANLNHVQSASLVTVVGSFKQIDLRYANESKTAKQSGFFEIVSLVGIFNDKSAHLHASVSNSKGQTFGGHLEQGNIIYTTAEVVIAEFPELKFSRELDAASGWDELVVRKK